MDDFRSSEDLPQTCDVLVIGGGFTGVATAYHILNDPSTTPSVVLLEARQLTTGATGRNGGHVKPDKYFGFSRYMDLYGAEAAAELHRFESAQLWEVKELVEREGLDCDFHLTRGLDVILDPSLARRKVAEFQRLRASGIVDVSDVAYTPKKDAERVSAFSLIHIV